VLSYLKSGDQLHLAHNFVFVDLPWDAEQFRTSIDDFEAIAEGTAWPAWFLANHDLPRVASRFDHDGLGAVRARAVALMLYALRGTPFVYQGEELGLPDAEIPPDRVVDVDGRDPERAPIPWRPPSAVGPGAGFTTGEPWLPLVGDAESMNAETQAGDLRSTLALTRRLAAVRGATPALQTGEQVVLDGGDDLLAWVREAEGDRLLAVVNFAAGPVPVDLAADLPGAATLLVSTDPDRTGEAVDLAGLVLAAGEGVLLRL